MQLTFGKTWNSDAPGSHTQPRRARHGHIDQVQELKTLTTPSAVVATSMAAFSPKPTPVAAPTKLFTVAHPLVSKTLQQGGDSQAHGEPVIR